MPEGAEHDRQLVDDWVAAAPIHFRGQALLEREIAVMKARSATRRRRTPS